MGKAQTYLRLGPASLARAALHRLRMKQGWYQKAAPAGAWSGEGPEGRCPWPHRLPQSWQAPDAEALSDAVERLSKGQAQWFGGEWRTIHTTWAENPESGFTFAKTHWAGLSQQSGGEAGDLKLTWEPSRFSWISPLMRAHAAGLPGAEEAFHQLFAAWRLSHPPNQGPAWMCGQETSLRILALMRAAQVFRADPELWEVVAVSAERIEISISYALAQQNNHAISEAVALFAASCALPNHPRSAHWRRLSLRLMGELCEAQFAEDGGYIQHSFNYQRMALRLCAHFLILAEEAKADIPPVVRERISAAWRFLHSQQDEATGRVPNYGANDGANPLALSACPYLDYRPALAAAAWAADRIRIYESGPWDEEAAWLGGAEYLAAPIHPPARASALMRASGHFVLRAGLEFAMMRCHAYRTRPGQCDSLHVDLWSNGRNLLRDAGSWRYWHPSGEETFFSSTAAHNTLEVNGKSHMPKISRFLYGDWVQDQLIAASDASVTGETHAYESEGVSHRRTLSRSGDEWIIEDRITATQPAQGALRWRLDPGLSWSLTDGLCRSEAAEIWIEAPDGASLELDSSGPDCWESLDYDERTRLPVLRVKLELAGAATVRTRVRVRNALELPA